MAILEFVIQIYIKYKNIKYNEIGCDTRFWFEISCIICELLLVASSSFNTLIYLIGDQSCASNPRTDRSNEVLSISRMDAIRKAKSIKFECAKIVETVISTIPDRTNRVLICQVLDAQDTSVQVHFCPESNIIERTEREEESSININLPYVILNQPTFEIRKQRDIFL
jgi:hypothetical protein